MLTATELPVTEPERVTPEATKLSPVVGVDDTCTGLAKPEGEKPQPVLVAVRVTKPSGSLASVQFPAESVTAARVPSLTVTPAIPEAPLSTCPESEPPAARG